jgi:O-acetylhomoserine/O-acetylserine sulfhydrylase-like pyridoxal-dependent enzyme
MREEAKPHSDLVRGFFTRSVHVGQYVDSDTGAIVPPIHVSSTYEVYEGVQPVINPY